MNMNINSSNISDFQCCNRISIKSTSSAIVCACVDFGDDSSWKIHLKKLELTVCNVYYNNVFTKNDKKIKNINQSSDDLVSFNKCLGEYFPYDTSLKHYCQ